LKVARVDVRVVGFPSGTSSPILPRKDAMPA
jgi:hypothetical protein